jgi:hypothetical protein
LPLSFQLFQTLMILALPCQKNLFIKNLSNPGLRKERKITEREER